MRELGERRVQLPSTDPPKMFTVSLRRPVEERQRSKPFSNIFGIWKDATRLVACPQSDVEAKWREGSESARATKDMW